MTGDTLGIHILESSPKQIRNSVQGFKEGGSVDSRGFPGGSDSKASACNAGDLGSVPGLGRFLEKEMATYSNILAWRI